MSASADLHPLAEAFPAVAAWLRRAEAAPEPPRTRADAVAARFGLDPFARDVLLVCAYAALEPEAAGLLAAAHGDAALTQPTIGALVGLLPSAHWSALTPAAPLRRHALIETSSAGAGLAAASVSLADSVLFSLLGEPALSAEVAASARRVEALGALTPARERLAQAIGARMTSARRECLQLCGADAAGKEQAAAFACGQLETQLYAINALAIPQGTGDIAHLARCWRRDLTLLDGVLYVDAAGLGDARPLVLFAELVALPLIIAAPEAVQLGTVPSLRLEMPRPRALEHEPLWREALGPLAGKLNGAVERLANAFAVPPELVASVASDLRAAAARGSAREQNADAPELEAKALEELAWSACRVHARPRMDDLAHRVPTHAGWDDLILPEAQKDVLRAIAAQVRQRAQVYESWGWAERAAGRGLGVSALFAGPSGSGKTMAGEVLGTTLKLDVYRVDLSSIVSKWLGETEKNLRRVFDAAEEGSVILQFDEADALFGKRSEVKDSHDRNANIEVSYLLQRFEEYRGLSILTTNLRANIDHAFLRRIRFIVDFSFPAPRERQAIWQGIFPEDMPREGLDAARLAQLNLTGGSIRNIALSAAFFAAEAGSSVKMRHILSAARLEYDKVGRVLTDAELRGWPR